MKSRSLTTGHGAFWQVDTEGNTLLAVSSGVEIVTALEQAGSMMAAATAVLRQVAADMDDERAFAALFLFEQAKAVVEACTVPEVKGGS